MRARKLLVGSLAAFGVAALPATAAQALQVKASINFGPTLTGPDNGTLIVTANPGDLLRITWALGTDTEHRTLSTDWFPEWIPRKSAASWARPSSSPARASTRAATRTPPIHGRVRYNAWSDGAPIGFAGNGGELWRIDYIVTNPVTDAATDMTFTFETAFNAARFPAGACPGTSARSCQCIAAH